MVPGQATRNTVSPSGGSSETRTWRTSANDGPCSHHATSASTESGRPSKTASTRPSGRLRTIPPKPAAWARRAQDTRYPTPCTRPSTTIRLRTTRARYAARGPAGSWSDGNPEAVGAHDLRGALLVELVDLRDREARILDQVGDPAREVASTEEVLLQRVQAVLPTPDLLVRRQSVLDEVECTSCLLYTSPSPRDS